MGKVTAMPGTKAQTHESVIDILEQMLERARNGEIDGLAVCAYGEQGALRQHVVGDEIFTLLGVLSAEQAYLIGRFVDQGHTYNG